MSNETPLLTSSGEIYRSPSDFEHYIFHTCFGEAWSALAEPSHIHDYVLWLSETSKLASEVAGAGHSWDDISRHLLDELAQTAFSVDTNELAEILSLAWKIGSRQFPEMDGPKTCVMTAFEITGTHLERPTWAQCRR
jgi:hypothetical protein